MTSIFKINLFTVPLFYGLAFFVGKWVLGAYYLSMFMLRGKPLNPLKGTYFPPGSPPNPLKGAYPSLREDKIAKQSKSPLGDLGAGLGADSVAFTLITGASSGLGKEMAIESAHQGMNVILVALPGRNLDIFCELLQKDYGIIARYYEQDLTCSVEIRNMVEDILTHYRVNFLINNAGIGGTSPFDESSPEFLEKIIRLNITAVSLLTRLLLPELKSHLKAHIINVSSMAAFSPFPYKTIYPASKAFIASFSRSLGEELKETSVKISVLHPGPILTNPDVTVRIIRQGKHGKRGLLPARILARKAINGVMKGKRVIVPGIANKLNRLLMTSLPATIIVPILAKAMTREIMESRRAAA